MPEYLNRNGNSSVVFYEVDSLRKKITVRFKTGKEYTYSANKIGESNYVLMLSKAKEGRGLGGLIRSNPIIRDGYDR